MVRESQEENSLVFTYHKVILVLFAYALWIQNSSAPQGAPQHCPLLSTVTAKERVPNSFNSDCQLFCSALGTNSRNQPLWWVHYSVQYSPKRLDRRDVTPAKNGVPSRESCQGVSDSAGPGKPPGPCSVMDAFLSKPSKESENVSQETMFLFGSPTQIPER